MSDDDIFEYMWDEQDGDALGKIIYALVSRYESVELLIMQNHALLAVKIDLGNGMLLGGCIDMRALRTAGIEVCMKEFEDFVEYITSLSADELKAMTADEETRRATFEFLSTRFPTITLN